MDTTHKNKAKPEMAELEQAFFGETKFDEEYYEEIVKQYPYQHEG